MKRFKKTFHPKLKRKAKSVVGISKVVFLTNEELRREYPELIMYTGGGGFMHEKYNSSIEKLLPIDLYPVNEKVP